MLRQRLIPDPPTESEPMKIGQTIKRLREEKRSAADNWRDWTQAACAARASMVTSYWGDLEGGRHSPSIETLEKVAAALGCTVTCLVSGL